MARIHVLREISEKNLDPKIPYVKGKDGKLLPKKIVKNTSSVKADLEISQEEKLEATEEQSTSSTEQSAVPSVEDVKPKKKFPPPKKKKVTDAESS